MSRQNGITVEDMLKLEVMEDCKIVAGFKGIRNTISKVNIMADPDIIDWVQEGEFLLTTAYSFKKDDAEEQKRLIKECSRKKLAGIGIKIYPYLDSLPEEVINLADHLDFPIIDIYYSIPLSNIMTEALKEIFNKQASLLERIEKVHEEYMNAMLEGNGIGELALIVSENIKNPVYLSLDFCNENVEIFDGVDEDIKEFFRKDIKKFYEPISTRSSLKRLEESKVLINGKYIKRMIMPIIVKDNIYGHIFTWAINTPLGGFDLSILESASTAIALGVLQELSVKEVEIRYRSEFFEDLISTDLKRKKKALERAHFFNLNYNDIYIIEVMSFKFILNKGEEFFVDYVQDYVNKVVSIIEDIISNLELHGIVASKMSGIQILLGFEKQGTEQDKLKEFNDLLERELSKKFENMEFKIGVGRAYKGLEDVNKSFSDALKTIRTGKVLTDKRVVTYDELGIFKILCQDFLTEELEDFYNGTLKSLADYDKKKSTELVKTLESYFEHNGNLKKMSDALYTHYNTILYRINRINEITGMNLDDPNDRLNLEIALKIKELLVK
ncbi:PucR family transcriptional regulator [Sporanaerobacter acetigenes]|uniref:Transcriptional regulator, CdaR family n=1 Tax=Sporanaerobacter acetigenes DSM 13106 TaxID=1123281 RepID=A0A1M5YUE0_9FIRM|nr:PucR family transcriptional regulator [Sporanaerobacter acetigenes]SHI15203.1 transcriptional regulator, CdaR family [Sporanaerobacter acetigenes DSM 13106]